MKPFGTCAEKEGSKEARVRGSCACSLLVTHRTSRARRWRVTDRRRSSPWACRVAACAPAARERATVHTHGRARGERVCAPSRSGACTTAAEAERLACARTRAQRAGFSSNHILNCDHAGRTRMTVWLTVVMFLITAHVRVAAAGGQGGGGAAVARVACTHPHGPKRAYLSAAVGRRVLRARLGWSRERRGGDLPPCHRAQEA